MNTAKSHGTVNSRLRAIIRKPLLTGTLLVVSLVCARAASAEDGTFTVSEGAAPWFDRVGQWSLTNVPDKLKGTGPLPQGDCSSRSLEVPGKPASITLGVQTNDVAKFTEKFPAAKETGDQISVQNPAGVSLVYAIFTLPNPPEKIDGAGVYGAGLLLLKVEGSAGAKPAASPSGTAKPAAK